jgi:hypothetical protein
MGCGKSGARFCDDEIEILHGSPRKRKRRLAPPSCEPLALKRRSGPWPVRPGH